MRDDLDQNDSQFFKDTKSNRQSAIRVHQLYKSYDKWTHAIQGISFGVDSGECFALLGVNGAGKTTTFKTLTRDVVPDAGLVSIRGHSVRKQFKKARQYIGYCPQVDAIFYYMTVREHLDFYA